LTASPARLRAGDGTAHHEMNLVFHADITDTEPASRESHLEFRWLDWTALADADLRPAALKDALLRVADRQRPFWRSTISE
jgi:hypothetical protein